MDILMSETCWAHNKWNKTASDITLVFHSSTIAMMHGPINTSFFQFARVRFHVAFLCISWAKHFCFCSRELPVSHPGPDTLCLSLTYFGIHTSCFRPVPGHCLKLNHKHLVQRFVAVCLCFFWCNSHPPSPHPNGRDPPHSRGFWITHDAPQSVGLLWTSDQPVAETSTWQHTTLTTDKHPCLRRDSNPWSQQASGRRPCGHWDRLCQFTNH